MCEPQEQYIFRYAKGDAAASCYIIRRQISKIIKTVLVTVAGVAGGHSASSRDNERDECKIAIKQRQEHVELAASDTTSVPT